MKIKNKLLIKGGRFYHLINRVVGSFYQYFHRTCQDINLKLGLQDMYSVILLLLPPHYFLYSLPKSDAFLHSISYKFNMCCSLIYISTILLSTKMFADKFIPLKYFVTTTRLQILWWGLLKVESKHVTSRNKKIRIIYDINNH